MKFISDPNKQHTLKSNTTISGTGLHTGIKTSVTLTPALPNFGFQFQRVDLPNKPIIKADCDLVTDTSRGTTLESNGVKISTVEHLLAALVAKGVDNCLIQIDGVEIPILDGSAYHFIEAIEKAGVVMQDADKKWYEIDINLSLTDKDKNVDMLIVPSSNFEINCSIDFNSPVLGTQSAVLKNIADLKEQICPARTFCFLHELEVMLKNNLIKGGDINNAIIIVDKEISKEEHSHLAKIFNKPNIEVKQGYLNNLELRSPNEPARHKVLDIVGDLALIGYPIKGKIFANRPGHKTNIDFAKLIKNHIKKNMLVYIPKYNPSIPPIYNVNDITNRLPHRYPFLMVDKIIEISTKHIVGLKNVTFNEPFFMGHFPNNPIFPGVLQIEALAQAGGILALYGIEDAYNYDTYLAKIDDCKFKQKITPGDTVLLHLEYTEATKRGLFFMRGRAIVGGKVCSEALLTAQVIKVRNDVQ